MAESFVLNTGARIPSVGLGTWQIESGAVSDTIYAAVKAGYRHIDSAVAYRNQKEVGLALKQLFEDRVVKREDLFITSKLWPGNHAPEDVQEDIDSALGDLRLDYVDLYLIHGPIRIEKGTMFIPENLIPTDIPATWEAMEKVYYAGKARAIGGATFPVRSCRICLLLHECLQQSTRLSAIRFGNKTSYVSYASQRAFIFLRIRPLVSPGSPGYSGPTVLTNPIVISVAEKLQKTPAQVALRWGLQMGQSVLPKSANQKDRRELRHI